MKLTSGELRRLLTYNANTGVFTWNTRVSQRCRIGDTATGRVTSGGYIQITISGRVYVAHRLAWLYVYGEWPDDELDHVNGNRSDNRIVNLRPATRKQNMENKRLYKNSSSGSRGVSWDSKAGMWRASVTSLGKAHHLGFFHDKEEAAAVAREKRLQLFTHNTLEDLSPQFSS